jgi:hypothetical protein
MNGYLFFVKIYPIQAEIRIGIRGAEIQIVSAYSEFWMPDQVQHDRKNMGSPGMRISQKVVTPAKTGVQSFSYSYS